MPQLKILSAATKTWSSQTKKYLKKKNLQEEGNVHSRSGLPVMFHQCEHPPDSSELSTLSLPT